MTKRSLTLTTALAALVFALPAAAALPQGTKAPEISTTGAVGGSEFKFDLKQELKKGPVVLYFFPKAFTQGCTLEAHAFADAMKDFKAAGAQVVGMSADNLATLKDFSTKECRSAFPVAPADAATIKAYDVHFAMNGKDTGLTNRTSYVIGRNGKIVMVHSDLNWAEHVAKTLAAVKAMKKA